MLWGNRSHHGHFPGFPHMLFLEPRRGWPPARPEWTCTSQKGPIGTPGERTLVLSGRSETENLGTTGKKSIPLHHSLPSSLPSLLLTPRSSTLP